METIADVFPWVETMRSELGQQVITAKRLADAFTESDIQLIRHDQVASLRRLLLRVMEEVEDIKQMEAAAQDGHNEASFAIGIGTFALGSILSAASGIGRNPLKTGLQLALTSLSREIPYGKVLITVGEEGLPSGVTVVPVSRLARESSKTEAEIMRSIQDGWRLLMTPNTFTRVLDNLEQRILEGSLSLPVLLDEIIREKPEGA